MAILSIENIKFDDKHCYVEAIVEDVICTRQQTQLDPAEYGPGLCSTSFSTEDLNVPSDEKEFMKLLEEICPVWQVVDNVHFDRYKIQLASIAND